MILPGLSDFSVVSDNDLEKELFHCKERVKLLEDMRYMRSPKFINNMNSYKTRIADIEQEIERRYLLS